MGKKKIIEKGSDQSGGSKSKAPAGKPSRGKKKAIKVDSGRIYIKASYNNTVMTVTDDKGNVVAWATSGATGFSGPKKATPFAASKVVASLAEKIAKAGPQSIDLYVSGIGPGRDSAIRALAAQGFDIKSIKDITPIAHNGPRRRKEKRN